MLQAVGSADGIVGVQSFAARRLAIRWPVLIATAIVAGIALAARTQSDAALPKVDP